VAKKSKANKAADKKGSGLSSDLKPDSVTLNSLRKANGNRDLAAKVILALMLIVLSLLMLIGPFYRGLFFPHELLVANIVVFGLLIFWGLFRIIKNDGSFISSPLDICLMVLLLAYLVSFLGFAAHKRNALEELLKIASYLVIYLVALDICRYWFVNLSKKSYNQSDGEAKEDVPSGLHLILHILVGAATVLTVASLGVAAGHWDFVGAYDASRIASPMGYANTAAAYFMAAYFLTLALAPLAAARQRIYYLAPAALMLITVILTFSRGAWLLLPPLALILILTSSPGNRVRVFLYMLATAIPALPAAFWVDPIFRSANPATGWLPIIISIVLAVLLGFLAELYLSRTIRFQVSLAIGSALFILALLIIVVVVPLLSPLQMNIGADDPDQVQVFKQVLENMPPDEKYVLTLEVDAFSDLPQGVTPANYWGIVVLGGMPGYRDVVLLNHQGMDTDGWEELSFEFQSEAESTRLEIQLYNTLPGTSFTVRNVKLLSSAGETTLRFAWSRIIPERFYERIFSYSRDRNVDRRFELFRDAIKVIKDYPVFGLGGGGWAAVYQSYQDQPYASREVHNHYLQVWIEAGVFGFIAFIGLWVSFALAFYRNCSGGKTGRQVWQYWSAAFIPAAALGAHSIIDWNFSMAAVGIFLFTLFGAGASLDKVNWFAFLKRSDPTGSGKGLIVGIGGVVLGVALFIYSIVLYNGLQTTWRSQELFERGNIKQALVVMEQAAAMDPYRAENYHNYNALIEAQVVRSQNPAEVERLIGLARRAHELEPYNPTYLLRYGDLLLSFVDIRQGLDTIDKIIILRPHAESSYQQAGWMRLRLIEYFAGAGAVDQAQLYAAELNDLADRMNEKFGSAAALAYPLGRTAYLAGDYPAAARHLAQVPENDPMYADAIVLLRQIRGDD
jgi:O-antigen ligase